VTRAVGSETSAATEPGARRTGLYALLALIVGVAAALVVTSALAYRRAREVEGMLGRAQAEALLRSLAPSLRRGVDDGALARLLAERRGDGLRYVGVIGPGGDRSPRPGASLEPATCDHRRRAGRSRPGVGWGRAGGCTRRCRRGRRVDRSGPMVVRRARGPRAAGARCRR
jgi:hypothetical protein